MSSETLENLVSKWLEWDQDPVTTAEIQSLWNDCRQSTSSENKSQEELQRRLCNRIQFGTAGLRGRMQAGFAFINCLTVIQASQGLAEYVSSSDSTGDVSVLIGHDTRHNSARYARLAANAFIKKSIKVYMFEDYVPTPFVAFGVKEVGAKAGIMVTASHNPAADNGYKVYQSNGAQINTPVDASIAQAISANLKPWDGAWDESDIRKPAENLLFRISAAYRDRLAERRSGVFSSLQSMPEKPRTYPLIAGIYTPMHGVGWATAVDMVLRINNALLIPVPEQVYPNPDFPTVKFPNPEEDGALQLAYETADRADVTLVLANDPDADRFAVAQKVAGVWRRFTGDQIGALFAEFLLTLESQGDSPDRAALLCSAVSSSLLGKMVKAAGSRFHFEETLTGFKWIGNRAKVLQDEGFKVLFGYEEALGYMFPDISWDKDGIAALSTFLFALSYWKRQGMDPWSKLQSIYEKYGFHESINTYFVSPSPSNTKHLFEQLRQSDAVKSLTLGSYKICRWRDVTNGTKQGDWDGILPQDESSQMLQFHLTHPESASDSIIPTEISLTIRASGTEPKVKVYLECSSGTEQTAFKHASQVFSVMMEEWILPFGKSLKHCGTMTTSSNQILEVRLR